MGFNDDGWIQVEKSSDRIQTVNESKWRKAEVDLRYPKMSTWALLYFFDSTAKTLVIYTEFWYFSRSFSTLFSQLISIFMSLLHTFSMGVKIDARLPRSERFASIMRSGSLR